MSELGNIIIRSITLFIVTFLLVKIIGKKQSSRFDIVNLAVIGVTTAAISLDLVRNLVYGFIVLAVWTFLPTLIYLLAVKYKPIRDFVQGKESVLINQGKILEDKLSKALMTPEDLLSQLRKKNVFNFADVEFAVLENNGDINILLKKDKQPITAKALNISVGQESVPQTVMLNGVILNEPLTKLGLSRNWLFTELEKAEVIPENVVIAQVDSTGQLYLDIFNDKANVPKPKAKELAFFTLKKCHADFEQYTLDTNNLNAKNIFIRCSKILSEIVDEVGPFLIK